MFKTSSGRRKGFGQGNYRNRGRGNFRRSKKTPELNIRYFIQKVKQDLNTTEVKPQVVENTFADFSLDQRLLRNITQKGFSAPTPIQDKAIPPLLEGRDVIGLANTGTGKTAAFLIPLINKMLFDRTQKALILAPTRELAVQIEQELTAFARGLNLFSVVCIGGTNIYNQARKIKTPFNFLIGTPGRVIDLYERRFLHLDRFQNVVLDEADRMVDMGFINDMKLIFSKLPKQKHGMFFTATLKKEIQSLVEQFLTNPVTVSVKKRDTSANVEQDIIEVGSQQKIDVLIELLKRPDFEKVLVFGRTKFGVEKLSNGLRTKGFRVDSIHGDKSQNYRLRALHAFKNGSIKVLIATDVAARGLDIDSISHVVNYDLPANYDDYVHRIGRTGRAERKGKAISLV